MVTLKMTNIQRCFHKIVKQSPSLLMNSLNSNTSRTVLQVFTRATRRNRRILLYQNSYLSTIPDDKMIQVPPTCSSSPQLLPVPLHQQQSTAQLSKYLQLESYDRNEIEASFDKICQSHNNRDSITLQNLQDFLYQRVCELDDEQQQQRVATMDDDKDETIEHERKAFAETQAHLMMQIFPNDSQHAISKQDFCETIQRKASRVDMSKTLPIGASMFLAATAVGISIPALPQLATQVGLSSVEFGSCLSAFALARMVGNIPSAIGAERYGRKQLMTYSLGLMALGSVGVGFVDSFEGIYACRFVVGLGSAAFINGALIMISDVSTPLCQGRSLASMMSVWFLGLAIGPGLGGMMTQQFGIHETFYMIGLGFLGGALANGLILSETKDTGIKFPWRRQETDTEQQAGVVETVKKTTLQWVDLMKDSSIQSTMLLYAVYWAAMTGAHFTVLPFLLTDPNGLALEPIQVGQVFTAFACTQMAANPVMARVIDYIGSGNGVIAGCALYGASIAAVASSPDTSTLFPALGLSAVAAAMMNTAPTTFLFSRASLADRPQALALLRTSGDFGFLVGAALAGAVADFTGSFGSAMQSCSSLLALGTIWYAARQAIDHCSTASSKKE